jgi:hypothetical protein
MYTCEMCKGTFEKEWSDKEALEEAKRLFPGMDHTDMVLLCDDCFQKIQAAAGRKQGPFN